MKGRPNSRYHGKERMSRFICVFAVIACVAALLAEQNKAAKSSAPNAAEWPMYNHDYRGDRYSPLTQINPSNVAKLTRVWTFTTRTGNEPPPTSIFAPRAGIGSEATPIVANGVMYVPAGKVVLALDPETGKEIWRYEVSSGLASSRGVAYWPGDGQNPPRVLFTAGRNLVALNANTGKLDPGFGKEGIVEQRPFNTVGARTFQHRRDLGRCVLKSEP